MHLDIPSVWQRLLRHDSQLPQRCENRRPQGGVRHAAIGNALRSQDDLHFSYSPPVGFRKIFSEEAFPSFAKMDFEDVFTVEDSYGFGSDQFRHEKEAFVLIVDPRVRESVFVYEEVLELNRIFAS